METSLRGPGGKAVVIGEGLPTVIMGERINPFGKGPVKEEMAARNMEPIRKEALEQVEAGSDVLIVSVAAFGIDEVEILPMVARAVVERVDVPLCLESRNPEALEKVLRAGCGKPIVSSVTGEDRLLDAVLPLVKQYGTAIIALASDASGIPKEPAGRLEVVRHILSRTDGMAIPREDILVDCVAESSAVNEKAAGVTLRTMEMVKKEWGLNLVLGASNVSFGLPDRTTINAVFLALAIRAGLNAAIANAARMKPYIMATDLLMGRDPRARRLTAYCRRVRAASAT
ncbi:MAG: dihydropteroate synthase [Syntrophorhabdales bacterium]|jgi:5-methyltetrahydrofolate--homocysteine methyltransferase